MTGADTDARYEPLNYTATLAKLADLVGREVLVELRVGNLQGPFRLAAKGVLVGPPRGQPELTGRRPDGDDLEAFMLDTGGFLAVKEEDFLQGEWHAGNDEGQFSAQPRLNIGFTDSVLHVAVLWRQDPPMDEQPNRRAHAVRQDQPAPPHTETREETMTRVFDSVEVVGAEQGGSVDPSSRRGLNRTLGRTLIEWAAAGALVGAVLGLVLSFIPGPFEMSSPPGAVTYAAALALAGALVASVIAAFVPLEREDGRVEREVEESIGRRPEDEDAGNARRPGA